jgi:hypothetical protein
MARMEDAPDRSARFSLSDYIVSSPAPPGPRRGRPGPAPPPRVPEGVLRRNDTSYPVKMTAKLRALYERYLAARADPADPEHKWASALKYYQYLCRTVMSDAEYGLGADGNARGLLIYAQTGMGKTRLAVAIAMALWDVRQPVVLLPRSLQKNFRATVAEVVALLNPGAAPEALAAMQAEAVARFAFASMDAFNAADQVAHAGAKPRRGAAPALGPPAGGLDGKLLIVDEAHNFFRAIINSSAENANARRIYEMVMGARNLRLLFLTGTPAAKDPFELVPCFNMLAGFNLLPPQYEVFYKLYVDRGARRVRNRERLANRLVGLVSHVALALPTEPPGAPGEAAPLGPKRPGDAGWFPVEEPTVVERVPMGAAQYRRYLLAREKEEAEGRGGEGAVRRAGVMEAPPLALPGSEKKAMRSYYVKSRATSLFAPPREHLGTPVDAMPDEAFTAETGPKLALIAERADRAPGPVLVYSQFVDRGLKPLGRFLRRLGYAPYVPALPAKPRQPAGPSREKGADAAAAEEALAEEGALAEGETVRAEEAARGEEPEKADSEPAPAEGEAQGAVGGAAKALRAAAGTAPAVGLGLEETQPASPRLVVKRYRADSKTLLVARDDLLLAGTKQRAAADYIASLLAERPGVSTLLYTAPYNGFGPVAAAYSAARLGLACRLVLLRRAFGAAAPTPPAEVERAETVRRARALGAEVRFADTWGELVAAGREAEADPAVFWVPLGFHGAAFSRLLGDRIRAAAPPGLAPGRVWVAGGTGALALALARAFPRARVTVVPASLDAKVVRKIREAVAGEPRITVAETHAERRVPPPYPTVAGYDERAWDAAVAEGDDGDLVWNAAGTAPWRGSRPRVAAPRARRAPRAEQARPEDETPPEGFPYRSAYLPPVPEMFARLKALAAAPPREWEDSPSKGTVEGPEGPMPRLALVRRTYPGDFDAADSITDHFVEPVRILCRERGEDSPAAAWRRLVASGRPLPADPRARRELVYARARGCNLFNAALAVYLLGRFGARDVLDCTAGWGDRLVAAHAAGARLYRGWDTNPKLQPVYAAIGAALPGGVDWEVALGPFEGAAARFGPDGDLAGQFDTTLFCPPYFDKEVYQGPGTSTEAHPTAERWYAEFYRPAVRAGGRGLGPGGHFLAYVTEGRMRQEAGAVLAAEGFEFLGAVGFQQVLAGGPGPIRDTFVWRRPGAPATGGDRAPAPKGHYAIISGEVPTEARDAIVRAATAPSNAHGADIKALLVSKTGAEGLDLKFIRETHTAESYWDMARLDQVRGRAARLGSHDGLPPDERVVRPYVYLAVANPQVWGQMPEEAREAKSIDEQFYDRALGRYEVNLAFRRLLAEVSLECSLFSYGNCRSCVPTGAPLFHDDPELDARLPDPCETRRETELEAVPVHFGGITYYYAADPASPLGFTFFVYREDLGGYAPLDPADPIAAELLRLVSGGEASA